MESKLGLPSDKHKIGRQSCALLGGRRTSWMRAATTFELFPSSLCSFLVLLSCAVPPKTTVATISLGSLSLPSLFRCWSLQPLLLRKKTNLQIHLSNRHFRSFVDYIPSLRLTIFLAASIANAIVTLFVLLLLLQVLQLGFLQVSLVLGRALLGFRFFLLMLLSFLRERRCRGDGRLVTVILLLGNVPGNA